MSSRARAARISAAIALLAGAAALIYWGTAPSLPELVPAGPPRLRAAGSLVVLGDTQRTSRGELLLLGREQNEAARRALIAKLAREEQPAFVVHLGDMVSYGASDEEWDYFDRLVSPLGALGIRILPVLGNHDYWGTDSSALRNARQRFPELGPRTFRALTWGGLGLVWLDSNLEGPDAAEQLRWFEATLERLERDPEVRGVLVFAHHPPFSNGRGRTLDGESTARLLPPFFRAAKTLALLSGHVHGYERFEMRGKLFIVSGGAGGPRVSYLMGPDAPYEPAYITRDGRPRAFHYIVIEALGSALRFEVKCLELDAPCAGGRLETFSVPFPIAP